MTGILQSKEALFRRAGPHGLSWHGLACRTVPVPGSGGAWARAWRPLHPPTCLRAWWTPASDRSATSYMFGGLHVGSLLGLLVAPPLIETFGWQTVRPLSTQMKRHTGL